VLMPLEPSMPDSRLQLILADSGMNVLLTTSEIRGQHVNLSCMPFCLDDLARLDGQPEDDPAIKQPDATLAYILYTSGSTGQPKGVMVEHRQLLSYVQAIVEQYNFERGKNFAVVQPLTVDSCHTMIFPALGWGGTLHLISRYRLLDGFALADYFQIHKIDHLKIAPSHYLALLSDNPSPNLLPRRTLILGGEALHWSLIERVRQLGASCDIWNHYGPTETTVGVLTYAVQRNLKGAESLPGAQISQASDIQRAASVPIGWPLTNVRVYVLDPYGNSVPFGIPGELYIGGDQVTRGYLGDPVRTAQQFLPQNLVNALSERLYRTGDRVRIHPDGAIEFLGRDDSQIKIRGFRVELGEVEVVLGRNPAVAEHAVLLKQDSAGQPYLAAYCTPVAGQTLDRQVVREYLQKHLPDYMVPASIMVLEKFPRTEHGKVNRRALPVPDLIENVRLTDTDYIAPQTPVQQVLAAIWKELLNVERVGLNDTFFGLGGHSLLIIRLVSRLNAIFMVDLPVRVVFEAQSLGEMADHLISVAGDQGRAEEIARIGLWLQALTDVQVENLLRQEYP